MVLRILKISLLLPIIFSLTNSVTPMSRSEIDNVTTCKNVTPRIGYRGCRSPNPCQVWRKTSFYDAALGPKVPADKFAGTYRGQPGYEIKCAHSA